MNHHHRHHYHHHHRHRHHRQDLKKSIFKKVNQFQKHRYIIKENEEFDQAENKSLIPAPRQS